MKYGLTSCEIEEITKTLKKFPTIDNAVLFGSRAMGNYKPGSDIDIAIYSKGLSFDEFLALKIAMEELNILQKLDLVRHETIENADLLDHINRVGIELY